MDYQGLIERLRNSCEDGIQPDDVYEAADLIEQLQAENERLNSELAKYRDAPCVVWRTHPFDYGIGHEGVYASTHFKEQSEIWKRKGSGS